MLIGGGHILENAGDATFTESIYIKDGAQLDNLSGGTINIQTHVTVDGAQLNNLAGGTINIQASSYLPNVVSTVNGGALNNFGLLGVDPCCPRINGVFNNHGSVDVRTGTSLTVYSTGTHSGEFHVADGATLSFWTDAGGNDFTATSNFTGLGNIVLIGGPYSTGTYSISGDFDLTGKLTANEATVNFASTPTSPGFALELTTVGLSSFVSFDAGLSSLNELILSRTSVTGLHIVGDTVVSGPVQWEGTMSGPGTTTVDGLVTAVTGLVLDGRTLIANGGFVWHGANFLLDNGAVFENAAGSTFTIDLTRLYRLRLITTSTPENPGRFVNSGLVTQTQGYAAQIMTDWRQTSTGVTDVYKLYFKGNTDISGTVIAPASTSLRFSGPDTGATINHRLNPDSTITALGTVIVGNSSGSDSDIINAEFAGVIDFSDPNSSLNVYGANTTLILPFGSGGGGTTASDGTTGLGKVSVDDGTLVFGEGTIACCRDGGGCVDTRRAWCLAGDGHPKGPGSSCDNGECPAGGACCFGDETCQLTTGREACWEAGSYSGDDAYLGDGTICSQCTPGVCCYPSTSFCARMPWILCLMGGGTFLGVDATCEPDPCGFAKPGASIEDFDCAGKLELDCSWDTSTDGASDACDLVIQDLDVGFGDSCTWIGRGDSPSNVTVTGDTNLGYWATFDVNNIFFIFTGSAEFYDESIVVLGDGGSLGFDGKGQSGDVTVVFGSAFEITDDETGDVWFNHANLLIGDTSDALKAIVLDLPSVLQEMDLGPYKPWSGSTHKVVFGAGLTAQGTIGIDRVNVEATGPVDVTKARLEMEQSSFVVSDPEGDVFFGFEFVVMNNGRLGVVFNLAFYGVEGDAVLVDLDPNDENSLISVTMEALPQPVNSASNGVTALILVGDSQQGGMSAAIGRAAIDTVPGIGTLTVTGATVVINEGSVVAVDINPLAVDERNDRLEIVATTATFDASLEVSIASGSECSVAAADAFAIVTGESITYPSGGDGRRILTMGGEGSFVVNQSPTGIVLDGFSLAGDGDGNGTVDSADTQGFVACLSGPGDAPGGGCDAFDFNGDGHTDMTDFAALQDRFGTACP